MNDFGGEGTVICRLAEEVRMRVIQSNAGERDRLLRALGELSRPPNAASQSVLDFRGRRPEPTNFGPWHRELGRQIAAIGAPSASRSFPDP